MVAVLVPLQDRVRHLPLAQDQLQARDLVLDQYQLLGQAPLLPREGAGLGLDLVLD